MVVGTPTVTMIRDPATGGSPTLTPGTPGAVVGAPIVTPNVPVLPSVGPGDCVGECPQPAIVPPLAGDLPSTLPPRFPAMNRLLGCGSDRAWVSGEYLLWWTKSTQLPVLAATGPIPASVTDPVTTPTPILAGSFGQTLHSGGRFGGGWWFSDDERRGIDARVFFLGSNGTEFNANSIEFPVLGRPFFNVNQPVGPLTDVIGAPGRSFGSIAVNLRNSLWGGEVNYRRYLLGDGCFRLDGLVGYRFMEFDEKLSITESGTLVPSSPLIAAGRAPFATATDLFKTTNNFQGGQLGLTGEIREGRWFLNARGTIAFGTVFETAQISGGQAQTFANGTVAQYQGGLLALPGANIGHYDQSRFAVMPEIGLNIGYHITPHLRVFAGYNFLYLSNVLRPANVIDPYVDASRIPNFLANPPAVLSGTPRPAPQFNTTDFWAQGINFGLQWTF